MAVGVFDPADRGFADVRDECALYDRRFHTVFEIIALARHERFLFDGNALTVKERHAPTVPILLAMLIERAQQRIC